MRFKFALTIAALAVQSSVLAGKYYFISAEEAYYNPPLPPGPNYLTSASPVLDGRMFSLDLGYRTNGFLTQRMGMTTATSYGVEYTVEWVGDRRDEQPPRFSVATWSFYQDCEVTWQFGVIPGGGPPWQGYVNVVGAFSPDAAGMSFNQTRVFDPLNSPPPHNPLPETVEMDDGGFTFTLVDGRWIGKGTFSIGLSGNMTGALANVRAEVIAYLNEKRTLIKIAGQPVL